MLQAQQDVEPALGVIVAVTVIEVERGTAAGVHIPSVAPRKVIRQLEVECRQRQIVPDANLDVGTEAQLVDESVGLDVAAEIKLVRLDGRADPDPGALRPCGRGAGEREQGHYRDDEARV